MEAYCRMNSLVTCGLTACTPGSAVGPTLGNEYGRTEELYLYLLVGFTYSIGFFMLVFCSNHAPFLRIGA